MVLTELVGRLRPDERRTVRALFELDSTLIDEDRSSIKDNGQFLFCNVTSRNDSRCAFEIHLGRGENAGRFNFYVGLGAEMYNYEDLGELAKQDELALDIERFLKARITCECHSKKGVIVRAIYTGDLLSIDSLGLKLRFDKSRWPLLRYEREVREYLPWLTEQ